MTERKWLKDAIGRPVTEGDMVFWRDNRELPNDYKHIGKIVWINISTELTTVADVETKRTIWKAQRNIMKMTDEEAMLWHLENN